MRVKDKIGEIENYLEELSSFVPDNFDEYTTNFQVKAACERYFEKIVEAVIDLAFLIVKERNLEKPEDDEVVFDTLRDNEIISKELCEKLKDAKGMRNILTHQYGFVDDEIVFHSITEELEKDVNEFVNDIKKSVVKA